MTVAEKAPRILVTAVRTAPRRSPSASWAIRAVITSVSVVPENFTPCRMSSSRSSPVFTRLPLWPKAMTSPLRLRTRRLRVLPVRRSRGRVAHVPDRVLAAQAREDLLVEHLADQAEILDDRDLTVVAHGDPGALLPPMLQRIEAEVREARNVRPRRVDAEDATRIAEMVGVHATQPIGVRRGAPKATRRRNGARPLRRRRAHCHSWYT